MLFRILLWCFILFFLVRFIVRFVLPLLQITRVAQDRMRQMQKQMEEMQQQQNRPPQQKHSVKEGDYIDYEEIK